MKHLATIVCVLAASYTYAQEKATVYLIRSIGLGGQKTALLDNGKELIDIKDKTYAILEMVPGEHVFTVQKEKREKLMIDFEAGKTYYLMIALQYRNAYSWEYYCVELTERSAKRLLLEDLRLHTD